MRVKFALLPTTIFLLSVVLCSCSTQSSSTSNPLPDDEIPELTEQPESSTLTQTEIDRVIEIALRDSRISDWLKDKSEYRVGEVDFFYVWDEGYVRVGDREYATGQSPNSDLIPRDGCVYPEVTISTGEEWIEQCQVFVDLEEEIVVMIDGPYPSLGSPGRFESD